MKKLIIVAATIVAASACGPAYAAGGSCTVIDGKADRRCTPGSLNPLVTSANLSQTICASPPPTGQKSWIENQRPPVSYTNALKAQQLVDYHEPGTAPQYKEDHLVPLEAGGNPRDPHNLFPQPSDIAAIKDKDERQAHHDICTGRKTIDQAAQWIIAKWTH
jgi:hypothetical protein